MNWGVSRSTCHRVCKAVPAWRAAEPISNVGVNKLRTRRSLGPHAVHAIRVTSSIHGGTRLSQQPMAADLPILLHDLAQHKVR